ncbi:hypothetical protein V5R04_06800 [Jonesiaceae bacterium BS-20]|uniref:DUF2892 domain-containing protein n=1 Tax=Jonesiaceae bacterium BS-20 TaxID=3120821 RepID=A0AAU7E054_9MICO
MNQANQGTSGADSQALQVPANLHQNPGRSRKASAAGALLGVIGTVIAVITREHWMGTLVLTSIGAVALTRAVHLWPSKVDRQLATMEHGKLVYAVFHELHPGNSSKPLRIGHNLVTLLSRTNRDVSAALYAQTPVEVGPQSAPPAATAYRVYSSAGVWLATFSEGPTGTTGTVLTSANVPAMMELAPWWTPGFAGDQLTLSSWQYFESEMHECCRT